MTAKFLFVRAYCKNSLGIHALLSNNVTLGISAFFSSFIATCKRLWHQVPNRAAMENSSISESAGTAGRESIPICATVGTNWVTLNEELRAILLGTGSAYAASIWLVVVANFCREIWVRNSASEMSSIVRNAKLSPNIWGGLSCLSTV